MFVTGRDIIHAAGRPLLERAQGAGKARADVSFDDVLFLVNGVSGGELRPGGTAGSDARHGHGWDQSPYVNANDQESLDFQGTENMPPGDQAWWGAAGADWSAWHASAFE